MYRVIKDSLKELSIAILILGLLRQLIYYGNFKLPIKYFLGLSELWLIISDDLIFMGPLIFVLIFANHKMQLIKDTNQEHIHRFSKYEKILFLTLIAIFLSLFVGLIRVDSYLERLNIGLSIVLYLLICGVFIAEKFLKIPLEKFFSFFSIGMFLLLLIFKVTIDISNTTHGKYKGTTVITDKKNTYQTILSILLGKLINMYSITTNSEKPIQSFRLT